MEFLLPLSVLLLLLRPTVAARENQGVGPRRSSPTWKSSLLWPPLKRRFLRSKRSTPQRIPGGVNLLGKFGANLFSGNGSVTGYKIEFVVRKYRQTARQCVYVTAEENIYYHKSEDDSDNVCGIYFFTDPDRVIEVHFDQLNVPCESGGLVTVFDGWELNGKFFPGVDDHEKPFEKRHKEFCGVDKEKRVFTTAQNAGMIHYRVPAKGKGFSFHVKFPRNPTPCNILVEGKEHFYTLRNYRRATNCTLIAVFPAKVNILALDVGVFAPLLETGTIYQCEEKQMTDGLQIGGSEDLDSSQMVLFEDICGLDSSPGIGELVVGCEVSVVRLVSSGNYDNAATVSIGQPEEIELLQSTFTCEL